MQIKATITHYYTTIRFNTNKKPEYIEDLGQVKLLDTVVENAKSFDFFLAIS